MNPGNERIVTGRTKLAVVIGDPIERSLSPVIHNAAFESLDLDWTYAPLRVSAEALPDFVSMLRGSSIAGVSVTMPHKQSVADLVDRLDASAATLSSVNTIVRSDSGELVGHSTDGDGLCDAFLEAGVSLSDRRVLVLGAGGAARSIVDALARTSCGSIHLHNRTARNAERLLPLAGGRGTVVSDDDLPAVVHGCDVVINATSVGMGEPVSPLPDGVLNSSQVVADIVYHPLRTALLDQAESAGCRTIDGLRMLILQAVRQQVLWTGRRPDVTSMTRAARRALG
ncbi:MAG: shikimate dehydrogenase [Ilumatobacteraceae bacterium]|nr:shikimate dehydrogenase [Ilumatobacteraceae bacterium]